MGWCSATEIFDEVCSALLDEGDKPSVEETLKRLVIALEDGDWDCQSDSRYWDHPVVSKIMGERHPNWFDD